MRFGIDKWILNFVRFTIVGFTRAMEQFKNSTNVQTQIALGICYFHVGSECPQSQVKYFLYTSYNQNSGEGIFISPKENNLSSTRFDPFLDTKIIIHGFNSDMFLGVLHSIKDEYFKQGYFNIILVDWSSLAKGPCYPAAVWNCRITGTCLAKLIKAIHNISNSDVHVIGFSLGAHVAAIASNDLKGRMMDRITGLDPALPGFTTINIENRLDPSDALFVDIIHTNAFMQGMPVQCGHIDFYVNGGIIQPGCLQEGNVLACSHHRATVYFAESINSPIGFWGWSCPSYWDYLFGRCTQHILETPMGEHVNKKLHGIYAVVTNSVPPYAQGPHYALHFLNSNDFLLASFTNMFVKNLTSYIIKIN
ncbi:hypothetical protein FQA39_LY05887 [Lamprigera yunnana]|nr:hypothetical protein FQA39_LY05887 [Lamprigera yunnana]